MHQSSQALQRRPTPAKQISISEGRRCDGAWTSGGAEKWADSGRILQVEPKGLRAGGRKRRGSVFTKPIASAPGSWVSLPELGTLLWEGWVWEKIMAIDQTCLHSHRPRRDPNISPAPGKLLSSVYKLQRQLLNESAELPLTELRSKTGLLGKREG